jgi:hypothetical protein
MAQRAIFLVLVVLFFITSVPIAILGVFLFGVTEMIHSVRIAASHNLAAWQRKRFRPYPRRNRGGKESRASHNALGLTKAPKAEA